VHSSHLVADVERVCDYLIVLVGSRVRLAGDVSRLKASYSASLEDLVLTYLGGTR
jgi:ABC-2 type transport system ATP-binding protein